MHCNSGYPVLDCCSITQEQPACRNTGWSISDCCLFMNKRQRGLAGCRHTSAAHGSAVLLPEISWHCLTKALFAQTQHVVTALFLSIECCWLQTAKAWTLQAASPGEQRLPKSAALPGDRLKPGDKHGEQALLEAQPRETTLVALKAKTQVWQPLIGASQNRPYQEFCSSGCVCATVCHQAL